MKTRMKTSTKILLGFLLALFLICSGGIIASRSQFTSEYEATVKTVS